MYHVIINSSLRNVPSTFATRHRMNTSPCCNYNKARRSFSTLEDAQTFAHNLLGHISKVFRVILVSDGFNGYIIYQEGC